MTEDKTGVMAATPTGLAAAATPAGLAACARKHLGGAPSKIARLSGGAHCEMWSFRVGARAYVLRKNSAVNADGLAALAQKREAQRREAELLQYVAGAAPSVPVPHVAYVCAPEDGLGDSFIMTYLEGETIARKILRDAKFDSVRPTLAQQCGKILAELHGVSDVPASVPSASAAEQLAQYAALLRQHAHPQPVFELALRWLGEHLPSPRSPALVHGDFRLGNLMIDERAGVRAVLDWELAHRGDPMEDLGWLCVPSWRFGVLTKPVGGFGERDELLAAYEVAGGAAARGAADETALRYWEIFGTLKWGVMCLSMGDGAQSLGFALEQAAIGRRASETQLDLLQYLEEMLDAG